MYHSACFTITYLGVEMTETVKKLNGTWEIRKWVALTTLILSVSSIITLGYTVASDRFIVLRQIETNTRNIEEDRIFTKETRHLIDEHKENGGHPVTKTKVSALEKNIDEIKADIKELLKRTK